MTDTNMSSDETLLQRLGELEQETDAEFVLELLGIFLTETPKLIETISAALQARDLPALRVSAHTLKGSSLNIGARHLGELCLKMEEIGRTGQVVPPGSTTKDIETEFEHLSAVLAEYRKAKES